jgi:hypothetical protein
MAKRRLSTEQSTILAVQAVSKTMNVDVPPRQRAAWKLLRDINLSTICDRVPDEFVDETMDVAGLSLLVLAAGNCPAVTNQLPQLWGDATKLSRTLWECRNSGINFPEDAFTQAAELACTTQITELAFFLRRAWG